LRMLPHVLYNTHPHAAACYTLSLHDALPIWVVTPHWGATAVNAMANMKPGPRLQIRMKIFRIVSIYNPTVPRAWLKRYFQSIRKIETFQKLYLSHVISMKTPIWPEHSKSIKSISTPVR